MALIQKKTVLITGCSSGGIGWAMVKVFLEHGFHVFATARDPSKVGDITQLSNVDILELDVTIPHTISQCKDVVAQRMGGRLDVLVNNAGVEFVSPLLDVDIAEAKRMYDVNVWGPLSMVQGFAPLLIEARGVVVNQSSIDAVLNIVWAGLIPLLGVFHSSKAAEARMSEIMRLELEPLGVRVVTAMTGSADTPMFDKPGGRLKLPETSYYHGVQDAAYKERMDHRTKAVKVELLAKLLVKDVLSGAKGQIWRGAFAGIVKITELLSLTWLIDQMVNSERGLEQVRRPSS